MRSSVTRAFLLVCVVVSGASFGAETVTGPLGVLGVSVWGDGRATFAIASNPSLCGSVGSGGSTTNAEIVVMTSPPSGQKAVTADGARAMISTLTAAKLAGRRVVITAENSSSTSGCRVVGVQIYYQ